MQLVGDFVLLRMGIFDSGKRQHNSAQELQEEFVYKPRLHLKHIGIEPAAGIPMSLNIQVEESLLSGTGALDQLDEF
ncbi:hypothetical protein SBV1_1910002 [Verrucomicrobia bacterium]|nr:hypothetical protein SBV1_1910002 [Verrucomicrobiota bacterium]